MIFPSSFLGLLTLLFICLKLTGVIAWSWWWVLAPLLAVWAIVGAYVAFALFMAVLVALSR